MMTKRPYTRQGRPLRLAYGTLRPRKPWHRADPDLREWIWRCWVNHASYAEIMAVKDLTKAFVGSELYRMRERMKLWESNRVIGKPPEQSSETQEYYEMFAVHDKNGEHRVAKETFFRLWWEMYVYKQILNFHPTGTDCSYCRRLR